MLEICRTQKNQENQVTTGQLDFQGALSDSKLRRMLYNGRRRNLYLSLIMSNLLTAHFVDQ